VLDDVGHRRDALERRAHAVPVVLAEKNHRQLPDRRHIQRLVERPDVHRSFAEKADAHFVAAQVLAGERETGSEGYVAADDAVAAHEAFLGIEEVHGAALALGAARRLPEQLRHHRVGRDPLDERLAMLAVGADDVVVVLQRRERADGDRFLSDVEGDRSLRSWRARTPLRPFPRSAE